MDKQKLLEILAELHDELARAEAVDATVKEALRRISCDIDLALTQDAEPSATEPAALSNRWADLATEFETKHPHVASLVQQVTDLLSGMGI